jgi:hypothetical protein
MPKVFLSFKNWVWQNSNRHMKASDTLVPFCALVS